MAHVTKTTFNADAPAEYGFPNDSFDFPYMVTEDDATTGVSYDFASDGGSPRPYAFVSNEAFDDFAPILPGNQGNYGLSWVEAPLPIPSNDRVSVVPVAGSADLAEPRDTPYFAPGTNRLIHSDGPVAGGLEDNYDGTVATIGREVPGQKGPVNGEGGGYSNQLALATQAALFQQYSQTAALSALVASV